MSVIDSQGYRLNVGIVLRNSDGHLLLAKRHRQSNWQFPQGGLLNLHETTEQAMYRELHEELGLHANQVAIIAKSAHWYSYRLPRRYQRRSQFPLCIGQKQKWFLLQFLGTSEEINLGNQDNPEFNEWDWFNPMVPIQNMTIFFKQGVYEAVLNEFMPLISNIFAQYGQQVPGNQPQI